jgi:hypothetical protein
VKPLVLMNFASDTTLSGGPQAGSAPRFRPSTALLKQGFWQGRRLPARMLSWVLGTLDDNAVNQAHAALRNWQYVNLDDFSSGNAVISLTSILPTVGYTDLTGDRQRGIVALTVGTGGNGGLSRSADGTTWESGFATAITPNIAGVSIVGGAVGTLLVLSNSTSGSIDYSTDQGGSWTAGVVAASGVNKCAHYSAGLGKYFVVQATAKVYAASTPAGLVGATGVFMTAGIDIGGSAVTVASNGANVIVCGLPSVSSDAKIWLSTDAGVSWSVVQTLSGGGRVTYNSTLGVFVAVDTNGFTYTSPTGTTWTVTGSAGTTGNNFRIGSLVSAGPAIITTAGGAFWGGGDKQQGIAYSLDLGATWNYWFLDITSVQLIAANQRVYAYSGHRLWISGPLGAPGREV